MSVRLQHFYFRGDGRSDGSEQNGSGLGNAEKLATNIVCNVAKLLVNAGWVSSRYKYIDGSACNSRYDVDGDIIWTDVDTSNATIECPLTYETILGTTKVYLLISYNSTTSTTRSSLHIHLGDSGTPAMGWDWTGSSNSRTISRGLTLLYVPPNCKANQQLRLSSMAQSVSSGSTVGSLAFINSDSNYSFNVVTDEDTIGIILYNPSWTNNRIKGYLHGRIIDELLDEIDIASEDYVYKKYAGIQFVSSNTNEGWGFNNINRNYGHIESRFFDTYLKTPNLQYYDYEGNIITCNGMPPGGTAVYSGISLFNGNHSTVGMWNLNKDTNLHYSRILVGGINSNDLFYQPTVSPGNYIKGILDAKWLISIGSANVSNEVKDLRPIGQSYENKKYVHLGAGLLLGWGGGNNKGLLEDSDNPMISAAKIEQ